MNISFSFCGLNGRSRPLALLTYGTTIIYGFTTSSLVLSPLLVMMATLGGSSLCYTDIFSTLGGESMKMGYTFWPNVAMKI